MQTPAPSDYVIIYTAFGIFAAGLTICFVVVGELYAEYIKRTKDK